eukprot:scaffold9021_cov118-Isochrysis_galbana.AAC.4
MGKEWGRGGGVSGRPKDRGVPPCRRYCQISCIRVWMRAAAATCVERERDIAASGVELRA